MKGTEPTEIKRSAADIVSWRGLGAPGLRSWVEPAELALQCGGMSKAM